MPRRCSDDADNGDWEAGVEGLHRASSVLEQFRTGEGFEASKVPSLER